MTLSNNFGKKNIKRAENGAKDFTVFYAGFDSGNLVLYTDSFLYLAAGRKELYCK